MKWLVAVLCLLCGWCNSVVAATKVVVGVYHFPPAVSLHQTSEPTGMVMELLDRLNSSQKEFHFSVFETSPKRRYIDYEKGRYDLIFFESPKWGWQEYEYGTTSVLLEDEEVYLALKKPGRDQSFFNNLPSRKLLGMLGYHYGFAKYDADEKKLEKDFKILLSHSYRRNIDLILADRPDMGEVALVSRAYLTGFLLEHPSHRGAFLIAENPDQRYELPALIHPDSPVQPDSLEALLAPLWESGWYQQLLWGYGFLVPDALQSAKNSRQKDPYAAGSHSPVNESHRR